MLRYSETLDCPAPTHPVIQLRALVSDLHSQQGEDWCSIQVQTDEGPFPLRAETGTEDMPDAYSFVPICPAEVSPDIVAVWRATTGQPMHQEIFGHVCGICRHDLSWVATSRYIRSLEGGWFVSLPSIKMMLRYRT